MEQASGRNFPRFKTSDTNSIGRGEVRAEGSLDEAAIN